jgi:hemoglobin
VSLYERLGGRDAITAVVNSFVARCAGDDRINRKFGRTDIPRLNGMKITAGEFDALIQDLVVTLGAFDVPQWSRKNCSVCLGRCAMTLSRSSRRLRGRRFLTATRRHPPLS